MGTSTLVLEPKKNDPMHQLRLAISCNIPYHVVKGYYSCVAGVQPYIGIAQTTNSLCYDEADIHPCWSYVYTNAAVMAQTTPCQNTTSSSHDCYFVRPNNLRQEGILSCVPFMKHVESLCSNMCNYQNSTLRWMKHILWSKTHASNHYQPSGWSHGLTGLLHHGLATFCFDDHLHQNRLSVHFWDKAILFSASTT